MSVAFSSATIMVDLLLTFMQLKFSAANMWVTISFEIMHVGVPVAITQVVFSTVRYAHDCFCCNYAGDCFC